MKFWQFVACMCCVLSSGDIARVVMEKKHRHLPLSFLVRAGFYVLTIPASFGIIALPIYGFFVMPW